MLQLVSYKWFVPLFVNQWGVAYGVGAAGGRYDYMRETAALHCLCRAQNRSDRHLGPGLQMPHVLFLLSRIVVHVPQASPTS